MRATLMLENPYHFRRERGQCGGWGEKERKKKRIKEEEIEKKERGEGSELFRIRPVM